MGDAERPAEIRRLGAWWLEEVKAGGSTAAVTSRSVLTRPPARLESSAVNLLGHDHGAGPVRADSHDVRVCAERSSRIHDPLTIGRPGGEEIVEVVVGNRVRAEPSGFAVQRLELPQLPRQLLSEKTILDPSGDQSPTPARSCAGVLTSSTCDPSRFMV